MSPATIALLENVLLIFITVFITSIILGTIRYRDKTIIDEELVIGNRKIKIKTVLKKRNHISKKRRSVYVTTISGVKYMPNLFLDAHYEDKYVYATEFAAYKQDQRISLEGDFDKFYQLYAPVDSENEALVVMTPDVMLILRDELYKSDLLTSGEIYYLKTHLDIDHEKFKQGIENLLLKLDRKKEYSVDEKIYYEKNKLQLNSLGESLKVRTSLYSVSKISFVILSLLPLFFVYLLYFMGLYVYKTTTIEELDTTKLIWVSLYALFSGFVLGFMLVGKDSELVRSIKKWKRK